MKKRKEVPKWVKPLGTIQAALALYSARDVLKQTEYKRGTRKMWMSIVLLVNFIGPISYFLFGKKK